MGRYSLEETWNQQANLSQKLLRVMKHFPSFNVFIGEEKIS